MNDQTNDSAEPTLSYESPRMISLPAADVGALLLRFLGLKVLIDFLGQIPLMISMVGATRGNLSWTSVAIFVGWNLLIALGLLTFARPIAGVVFGRRSATIADLGPASWMTLIVAGAGVTFAIFSVGDLVTVIHRHGLSTPGRPLLESVDLFVPSVKVGVGLLFFFAPSLLVGPWVRRVAPLDET